GLLELFLDRGVEGLDRALAGVGLAVDEERGRAVHADGGELLLLPREVFLAARRLHVALELVDVELLRGGDLLDVLLGELGRVELRAAVVVLPGVGPDRGLVARALALLLRGADGERRERRDLRVDDELLGDDADVVGVLGGGLLERRARLRAERASE